LWTSAPKRGKIKTVSSQRSIDRHTRYYITYDRRYYNDVISTIAAAVVVWKIEKTDGSRGTEMSTSREKRILLYIISYTQYLLDSDLLFTFPLFSIEPVYNLDVWKLPRRENFDNSIKIKPEWPGWFSRDRAILISSSYAHEYRAISTAQISLFLRLTVACSAYYNGEGTCVSMTFHRTFQWRTKLSVREK